MSLADAIIEYVKAAIDVEATAIRYEIQGWDGSQGDERNIRDEAEKRLKELAAKVPIRMTKREWLDQIGSLWPDDLFVGIEDG